MLRLAAIIVAANLGSLAVAQEAPPPAAPPVQPRPAAPVAPSTPGAPADHGGGEIGSAGTPTRVPELLARTPDVARLSSLLGAEILDESCEPIGRLDDFVARKDGRLITILVRSDGRIIGLPLAELIARAKPDLEGGSERVTIKSFKLARVSRRLDAAPDVEDKSRLDEAWLVKLDGGTPSAAAAASTPSGKPAPGAPAPADERPAGGEPSEAGEPEAEPAAPAPGEAQPPASVEPPLPLLSALLGKTALDPAEQPIGTIVDVVVGIPKSQVAYLVVARRETPDAQDSFHAVPFEALGPVADDAGVRLTIGAAELQATPRLDGLSRLPVDPLATAAPHTPTPR